MADSIVQPLKRCTKCSVEKPKTAEYFSVDRGYLRSQCKICERKIKQDYYVANADKMRRRSSEWRKANPDYQSNYYHKNRDVRIEYCQQWRENNREKSRESSRRWSERNQERILASRRLYYKLHPEKLKAKHGRRRARKQGAEGTHSSTDIQLQIKSQTGKDGILRCWWCAEAIEKVYEVDHRIPLSKGGSNDARNLCITHRSCNRRKQDKLPHEWIGRLL
jgi:hypothetical protein